MSSLERFYIFCVAFMFFFEKGVAQIPPGHMLYESTSGCHGIAIQENQVNATCPSGSVIAINDVTMGAKPTVSGCPLYWNSTWTYEECCTQDSGDCNFPFYNNNQYHELCNGDEQCIFTTQFQQINAECNGYNGTFGANGAYSNYMFMDYYCVQDDYIVEMCTASSTSTDSDTVYIWNDNFPTSPITTAVTSCQCSVEIDNCESDIEVYTIYRNLAGNSDDSCEQNVTVYDSENDAVLQWNCDANSLNFNMDTVTKTYITVELNNQMNTTDGRVWLGFRPSKSSNITVKCPAKPQEYCEVSTTTTTDLTTTTTTNSTTATTDPSTTTDSSTTTDLTTTTVSTTTTMNMTTIDSTTTTIDTTTIDDLTEEPVTRAVSPEVDDKDNNLLTILVIVLAVLCLILIIVIVILCICLIKRRDTTDIKDAESSPNTDKVKSDEVSRTNYRNVKPDKVEVLPQNIALNGIHNGSIKVKTADMGCQTYSPVQSMADAQCQANPPVIHMNDASCQTELLNSKCVTKNKKSQVNLELVKIETDEKVTMTEWNLVDIAVQTDNKIKHKREVIKLTNNKVYSEEEEPETNKPEQIVEKFVEKDVTITQDSPSEQPKKRKKKRESMKVTNNKVHPDEEEPETDELQQTVEHFVEIDVPVSHDSPLEQPKKRKKKKKKYAEKYEDDEIHDPTVQEVTSNPVNEQEKESEFSPAAPPVDRFLFPVERSQTSRVVSEDSDSEINNNGTVLEPNGIEQRYRKQRNHIQHAFYAPERDQLKLEKFYRKYKIKKRKKQKTSSEA